MLVNGVLPEFFCESYTIPIRKTDNTGDKELNVLAILEVSTCPVISKVCENCLIWRFDSF